MTLCRVLLVLVGVAAAPAAAQQAQRSLIEIDLSAEPRASLQHAGSGPRVLNGRAQGMTFDAGVADFSAPEAQIDFGPDRELGFDSTKSFAIDLWIRARPGGFQCPLMCRSGSPVAYSLVLGRSPGTVSFEVWSWTRDRATSRTRVDDGDWHHVQAAYFAEPREIAMFVDGVLEARVAVRAPFTAPSDLTLRLGSNLRDHQPFSGQLRDVRVIVPEQAHEQLALRARLPLDPRAARDDALRWLARLRSPRRPRASSADDWQRQVTAIRTKLQDALGLSPPPPPRDLAVREGGRLDRDGYSVTRTYWQSVEGYWASGYLYRPAAPADGERPAVLCPSTLR